ncbi:MAG: hypothetical protein ACR2RD_10100 [Woeseiaceae bacterium]
MSTCSRLTFAIAVMLLASCHVGPQIEQSDLGRHPQGASILVKLPKTPGSKKIEYRGELLDVRDDGLVIVVEDDTDEGIRVVLIPWGKIDRVRPTDLPGIEVRASQGKRMRAASTEELRNVSRFPQGLSPELTTNLLRHYGQSTLETIE